MHREGDDVERRIALNAVTAEALSLDPANGAPLRCSHSHKPSKAIHARLLTDMFRLSFETVRSLFRRTGFLLSWGMAAAIWVLSSMGPECPPDTRVLQGAWPAVQLWWVDR